MSKFDKMISRQGVPICNEKKVEMPIVRAIVNDESMDDDFKEEDEEEDVVDYGREFWMQQNLVYESQPRKRIGDRWQLTNIFGRGRTSKEHDGLDHNLGGIKLKIFGF